MSQIEKRENSSIFWWVVYDIIVLILLLTLAMTSSSATMACVALLCVSFFIKSPTLIVSNILFFYPFYNLFKFGGVGISYYNLLILFAIVSLIFKSRRINVIVQYLIVLALFGVYTMLFDTLNLNEGGVKNVILDLVVPLSLFVIISQCKDKINVPMAFYMYSIGVILAGLCGTMAFPIPNLDAYIAPLGWRAGGLRLIRLQGLTINPNYFSLDVNLAIAALLSIPNDKRDHSMERGYKTLVIIILSIIGLMTLSKSFLLTMFLTVLFYLWATKAKNAFFYLVLAGVLVATYTFFFDNQYVAAMSIRVTDDLGSADALTSSRYSIWISYVNAILDNPANLLVGRGINAENVIIAGFPRGPHNTYLEAVYHFGIIGTLWLFVLIYKLVGNNRLHRLQYLPLFILLIRMFAIHILLREAFLTCLIVLVLSQKKGASYIGLNV